MSDIWQQFDYFPSSVYRLEKPEFLETVKPVAYEYLEDMRKNKKLDAIYPTYQTNNFYNDARIFNFSSYITQTAFNIIQEQGFDVSYKQTKLIELWLHYHYQFGSMEEHVHSEGSIITGFYILDSYEDSCEIVFHDPRIGKKQINIGYDQERKKIYNCVERINFKPRPGTMIFTNSWLPHSFTRNKNIEPFSFIHFNVSVIDYYPPPPPAEVI